MAATTSRLLTLLSLLQTPRVWSGTELAARLDVTQRTVRRDVDRLREMGYPVEAAQGVHGGYRLVGGTSMPPLLLEDDEAIAVAVGLRTVAVNGLPELEDAGIRALTKLTQSIPVRLRHRVRTLGASVMTWDQPGARGVDADVLTVLAATAANRERLRMSYEHRSGEVTARHVEPRQLLSVGRRWYLVAFDLDREAWRTFRADRITTPTPTGARASHDLPDPEVIALLERSRRNVPTFRADVTLRLPLKVARERLRDHLGDGELWAEEGNTRWLSATDTPEWLALRLLLLNCWFEVHGPPELRRHLDLVHDRTKPQG